MPPNQLRCTDCGCRFPLDREDRDARRVRCPECGAMVRVRSAAAAKPASSTKWILLAVLLVLLIGAGCCGGIGWLVWTGFGRRRSRTDPVTPRPGRLQDQAHTTGPAPQAHAEHRRRDGSHLRIGQPATEGVVDSPVGGERAGRALPAGGFAFEAEDWDQCKTFRDAGFVTMTPWLRGENGQPGNYTCLRRGGRRRGRQELAKLPGVDRTGFRRRPRSAAPCHARGHDLEAVQGMRRSPAPPTRGHSSAGRRGWPRSTGTTRPSCRCGRRSRSRRASSARPGCTGGTMRTGSVWRHSASPRSPGPPASTSRRSKCRAIT